MGVHRPQAELGRDIVPDKQSGGGLLSATKKQLEGSFERSLTREWLVLTAEARGNLTWCG